MTTPRVAALYDVHGNLPALEAVLAEAGDAQLVFGGDLAAGPLPAETLDRIMALDALVLRGNADRRRSPSRSSSTWRASATSSSATARREATKR